MKNKDTKWLYAALVAVILIGVGIIVYFKSGHKPPPPQIYKFGKDMPCPGETLTVTMKDRFMHGIIEEGQQFKVIMNWYACNPLEKDEIVYYRISKTLDPIVKIVRARSGDKFKLVKNKAQGNWNLQVNGEYVKSGEDNYFFGADLPPVLNLYEKPRKGILRDGELIVLSNVAPGDKDSGVFGLFNISDVMGKVELIPGQTPAQASPAAKSVPKTATADPKLIKPTQKPVAPSVVKGPVKNSKAPVKSPATKRK